MTDDTRGEWTVLEDPLRPNRGIVPLHNARGQSLPMADICRWMRLSRTLFKTDRIDLVCAPAEYGYLPGLISFAHDNQIVASLRVRATDQVFTDFAEFHEYAPYDVYLSVRGDQFDAVQRWLDACRNADLPVRVQLLPPLGADIQSWTQELVNNDVRVVNISPFADFDTQADSRGSDFQSFVQGLAAWANALSRQEIDVSITHLPAAALPADLHSRVLSGAAFFRDHHQYERRSYELARALFPLAPYRIKFELLRFFSAERNKLGGRLAPWLIERPWWSVFTWARAFRVWVKSIPLVPHALARIPQSSSNTKDEASIDSSPLEQYELTRLKKLFPDSDWIAASNHRASGTTQTSASRRVRYLDAIDRERANPGESAMALAREANQLVANTEPTRRILPTEYGVEGAACDPMEGGLRWFSLTNSEKLSYELPELRIPFTLALAFGGGMAEYIGFSLGRHCKIVAPMLASRHDLVLHITRDGRYVLLRDGQHVHPVEFEGAYFVPQRLGDKPPIRISIWNISSEIVTGTIRIWEDLGDSKASSAAIKYSCLIVSTRYSRRLQATLRSIAHQRGVPMASIEVVVCYVPGLDATEDLLLSVEAAYPDLRVVRVPFSEADATAKGFMINEGVRSASGEWVAVMDSDVCLHPETFARADAHTKDNRVHFIAPDGRLMLDWRVTGQVLLGEKTPWDNWEELAAAAVEYRQREARGVPVGFLQIVRRACFDRVQYPEHDHFEGADMKFAEDIIARFGKEVRLEGLPVLHLDHGGSHWYGALRHY